MPTRKMVASATRMTEMTIDTFRRSPVRVSLRMNCRRMGSSVSQSVSAESALGAVDPAGLVTDELAVLKLNDSLAHLVDDLVVVRGHHDRRTGPVDPVKQLHDAETRCRVEVS